MFYSHTFLARKGPLGTVWCAAHLQHKLKKSHYTSTDISFTVDRIMHPEVPIALRMSGHLLLGLVRIYSKKVDYLFQDCNVALAGMSKAYSSANINLPEDHAPFNAVTLPETFNLDALELEDDYHLERSEDNHLKRPEEITLEDQIPTGTDPYIVINLNEDIGKSLSILEHDLGTPSGPAAMEEDSHPSVPVVSAANLGDPSARDEAGLSEKHVGDSSRSPRDLPEIEIMRDTVHDFHVDNNRIWPDQVDDVMEPDRILEEQIMKDKEAVSPHVGEILTSGGPSLPAQQPHDPSSVASEQAHENLDLHISLGHGSPELALRSTPPVQQPIARQRKRRRQLYDESTVLTNKFMKGALEDSSNLLRKKRNCPSTDLEIWQLKNLLKKGSMFDMPLITGLSSELLSIYDRKFIPPKHHLISSDEVHHDANVPKSPPLRGDTEMEIEHLRRNEVPDVENVMSTILSSPHQPVLSPTMFIPSPTRGDKSTPPTLEIGSQSGPVGTDIATEVRPTPDFTPPTGLFGSDMETPATYTRERLAAENIGLSDIPELLDSAGDLNFLELDDNTPDGSQGTPGTGRMTRTQKGTTEFDALSARTRAVAQYLRRQSSATPCSEQLFGDLSLNSILEHKSRKICARMFFETLVLKNCGLVDVHQDEPYDDIRLRVTPKLSKEQL